MIELFTFSARASVFKLVVNGSMKLSVALGLERAPVTCGNKRTGTNPQNFPAKGGWFNENSYFFGSTKILGFCARICMWTVNRLSIVYALTSPFHPNRTNSRHLRNEMRSFFTKGNYNFHVIKMMIRFQQE